MPRGGGGSRPADAPGRRRQVAWLVLLAVAGAFALAAPLPASETVDVARPVGHPKDRFPLALHLTSSGDAALDEAVRRAVADWNDVAREALGVETFRWQPQTEGADVLIEFAPAVAGRPLGYVHLDVDDAGVIRRPVRIELAAPAAMGATSRETVLVQVAAHEMGHALGLPHTDDPGSIMCCQPGRVNLADPAVRQRYLEARRRPEVRSALGQLRELYPRFWGP